jgi:two-component system response regulator HydG
MKYSWPGNARELESAFEYAIVTCDERMSHSYHLLPDIRVEKQTNGDEKNLKLGKEDIKKELVMDVLSQANATGAMEGRCPV